MTAAWTLCLAALRTRKLQNGLAVMLILLSTLLLSTAANVLASNDRLFTMRHEETKGSHQMLTLGEGLHNPWRLHEWWASQEGVQTTPLIPYRNLSAIAYQDKDLLNVFLFMMSTPDMPFDVDRFLFAQGEGSTQPPPGTIWIPTSLAYPHGIKTGDELRFGIGGEEFSLTVSGVVIDIPYGAPFTVSARVWMNESDYAAKLQSQPGEDRYMLGLRYDDYGKQAVYWERFEHEFGVPYLEQRQEFEEISSFYLIMNRIVGFVTVFLGIVMLVIALFTIGHTISDAILSNYRTIGIYKSIGLTSATINSAFLLQYSILAALGIVPGLVIGGMLSSVVLNASQSFLKLSDNRMADYVGPETAAIGLLTWLVVLILVYIYASKGRLVQPAQAIRYGMSERESGKLAIRTGVASRSSMFDRFPVSAVLAWRHARKGGGTTLLLPLMAAAAAAVLVFGSLLLNSIVSIKQTAPLWGYDSAQVVVEVNNPSLFSKEAFAKAAKADSGVLHVAFQSNASSVVAAGGTTMNLNTNILEGSFEEAGFAVLRGKHPVNKNEIALGMNAARKLNKEVGDTVEVYLKGKKRTLTVTGIYQAIANMSYSSRMTIDAAQAFDPSYDVVELAYVTLADPAAASHMAEKWKAEFAASADALTQETLLNSVYNEASAILFIPLGSLSVLFGAVMFLIIYGISRIAIVKESRTYGVYRTIGLTAGRIRGSILTGTAALAAIGAAIGAAAGIYLLPIVLQSLLNGYGIERLPIIPNGWMIAGAILLIVAAASLGSLLSSKLIGNTSPRILIVD
ncbi:FtsX-like permease family protein [Paenibacillus sp. NPDC058071]|uniref:ABC transporter permease n=1 Tax=Paenibacillus sp. NPDC058071 TaxID=3346326 RepID=UPI0036D77F73